MFKVYKLRLKNKMQNVIVVIKDKLIVIIKVELAHVVSME